MVQEICRCIFICSFSKTGSVLCGVGKDSHNKNVCNNIYFTIKRNLFVSLLMACDCDLSFHFQMVVVWNTERCMRGGEVQLLAKAHTDVDIQRLNVAHFDDTR